MALIKVKVENLEVGDTISIIKWGNKEKAIIEDIDDVFESGWLDFKLFFPEINERDTRTLECKDKILVSMQTKIN